jgi:hypothetical protein
MTTVMKASEPYWAQIWMAGNGLDVESVCQEYCDKVGLCVTVTPTKYVYTAGSEFGFFVRLINYPRFPTPKAEIKQKALDLAECLMYALDQQSYTVEGPDFCEWYSRRKEDVDVSRDLVQRN